MADDLLWVNSLVADWADLLLFLHALLFVVLHHGLVAALVEDVVNVTGQSHNFIALIDREAANHAHTAVVIVTHELNQSVSETLTNLIWVLTQ